MNTADILLVLGVWTTLAVVILVARLREKKRHKQGRWDGDTGRRTSIMRQMPLKWRGEGWQDMKLHCRYMAILW